MCCLGMLCQDQTPNLLSQKRPKCNAVDVQLGFAAKPPVHPGWGTALVNLNDICFGSIIYLSPVAFPGLPDLHNLLPSVRCLPACGSCLPLTPALPGCPMCHQPQCKQPGTCSDPAQVLALLQTWPHPGESGSTVAASAPIPLHPCPSESTTAIPTLTSLHLSCLCVMPTVSGSVSGSGEAKH